MLYTYIYIYQLCSGQIGFQGRLTSWQISSHDLFLWAERKVLMECWENISPWKMYVFNHVCEDGSPSRS